MKFCVLPLSTRIASREPLTWPKTFRVWEVKWPINECKLIWVGFVFGGACGSLGVRSSIWRRLFKSILFVSSRWVLLSTTWTHACICDQVDTAHHNSKKTVWFWKSMIMVQVHQIGSTSNCKDVRVKDYRVESFVAVSISRDPIWSVTWTSKLVMRVFIAS